MKIKPINTISVSVTLLAWALIFIDGATHEGPIITFLLDGIYSSNIKDKILDFFAIISLLSSIYFIVYQYFKWILFIFIYVTLFLNIIRHINFQYFSWFMEIRTILPTILFLIFALISIFTIKKK